MAYLGVNPSERAYKQTPIYKAVAGETLLPISVGSPDSLLLRNGVILTKDVSNPTDYDWSVDPVTNRPRLVKGAVEGDEFTFIEFAAATLPDMLSKSRTNQQLAESPYVATPPSQPMQLATMAEVVKGSEDKNQIINPCFEICQRARAGLLVPATRNAYGIDMWKSCFAFSGATYATSTQANGASDADVAAGKIPYRYYGTFKSVCSNTASTDKVVAVICHFIENYLWASGKTVTLSMYIKGETAGTIGLAFGNLAANTSDLRTKYPLLERVPLTTEWRRIQYTFKMPDLATIGITPAVNNRMLSLEICAISLNDETTNSSDLYGNLMYQDNIFITGVQLELGSVATDFIPPSSPVLEELKCQRYFYAITRDLDLYRDTSIANNTRAVRYEQFPVPMRVNPTVSMLVKNGTNATDITTGISGAADRYGWNINCGDVPAGNQGMIKVGTCFSAEW